MRRRVGGFGGPELHRRHPRGGRQRDGGLYGADFIGGVGADYTTVPPWHSSGLFQISETTKNGLFPGSI